MPKFRKKSVMIEAVQWRGGLTEEPHVLLGEHEYKELESHPPQLVIHTLEGDHRAQIGDWIIRGVKGELYPCKPDIFGATYERVD